MCRLKGCTGRTHAIQDNTSLMNNIPGSTGLTSRGQDCNMLILTTSEYIGCMHFIQDDMRIVNKVPDGTGLASRCMTAIISYLQCQSILSHETCTSCQLLIRFDIDKLRHCEICTRAQIDHNMYDYSQYMTLPHDASQYFRQFGDDRRRNSRSRRRGGR
jgi:hypothetical protein